MTAPDFPQHTFERALVFANGRLHNGPAVQAALRSAASALIIAADGGTRLALACGLVPHLIVGDMDSLPLDDVDALYARGVEIVRHPRDKDENDLELALRVAAARGVTSIRVIGGAGGRLDQTLANITLLSLPDLAGRDVRLVDGRQTLWLAGPGDHTLHGAPGDTISLIPWMGEAAGVTTAHLKFPLHGDTLHVGPARGISNVMLADEARVSLETGSLLIVHTPGQA